MLDVLGEDGCIIAIGRALFDTLVELVKVLAALQVIPSGKGAHLF